MNKLTNEQIIDFLDGTLSPPEVARIEAHLKSHAEDAQLVNELRFAQSAAQEWHQDQELRVSDNFWPALREQLGPAPKRSVWSQIRVALNPKSGAKAPSRPLKLSLGAAFALVAVLAGALLFAPKNATAPAVAEKISAADRAFVQKSVQRHEAYIASQPVAGDVTSAESGAEEDEEDVNP